MKMRPGFFQRFKRITYSTAYLPEIDGLRFLAIFSVVVILHITGYLNQKFYAQQFISDEYWQHIVLGGGGGVTLFFMISGFILSWPFARWRLKGEKKVNLRRYYLRRLTRLEPPYIIALLIFFVVLVWVIEKYSFQQLLPHFWASLFYLHNFIYDSFSWVLPVAWSLEVKVQFYVVAPLLFTVFLIPFRWLRWLICSTIIIAGAIYLFDTWTRPHLFKFLHFFFCGILLADLYCSGIVLIRNEKAGLVAGLAALAGFIFIPSVDNWPGYLARLLCMFLLFHTVISNNSMRRLFSWPPFILIGGMCYSIYLLHFAVVSAAGQLLLKAGLPVAGTGSFVLLALLFSALVLLVSSVYFLVVEKPFMKPFFGREPITKRKS